MVGRQQTGAGGEAPVIDFATMLRGLARAEAFPAGSGAVAGEDIVVVQTHASAVLLTTSRAYKLKKPNNFGFFDYSTPELRRHFCTEEVRLNARLAPEVYLGVAPVVAGPDGVPRFAATCPAEAVPPPGAPVDGGVVGDYAVVMVRLPEEASLASLVRSGHATPALLARVAQRVARFHVASATGPHIAAFGGLDVIRANWEENFTQMQPYVGRALSEATFDRIAGYVREFLRTRTALFSARVHEDRIRDCHGDLRLQHVYSLGDDPGAGADLAIVDCIEFNERFRYGDVASEVAFLAMELDGAGRPDLARTFLTEYAAAAGDETLWELLPFYTCYRACVRGKVLAFQLDQPEVPVGQREAVRREAEDLFALAAHYASRPARPVVVLVGGLMGTGKTTLARRLHDELGWSVRSSDATRKRLAALDAALPVPADYGAGIYSAEWTARTYQALQDEALELVEGGQSVVLDASWSRRAARQALAERAARQGAWVVFLECRLPEDEAIRRLGRRWQRRVGTQAASGTAPADASDGRPELFQAQRLAWEPYDAAHEPALAHVVIGTTEPPAESAEQALAALEVARLVCWL
jgi:aminoglycoside phosphotransferase family enzyme/predicted kinase